MENSKSTQISDIIGEQSNEEVDQSQSELVQEIINEIKMQEQENSSKVDTSVMEEKVHSVPRSESSTANYTLLDKIEPVTKDVKKPDTFWTKIKKHLSMSFLKDVLVVAGIVLVLSLAFVTKNIVHKLIINAL